MAGRVLVTGVNGFVGVHLVRDLVDRGMSVVGLGRDSAPASGLASFLDEYVTADMGAAPVDCSTADHVVHLAGLSAVGASFNAPQKYITLNTAMVTNLLEPMLAMARPPKVLIVSSGAVYDSDQSMPISESGAVAATSPYVISKLAVENLARYYARRGINTVIVRPFNHAGPGQRSGFIIPDLAAAAVGAAASGTPLKVGNLETARDYTDVRDIAAAYSLILTAETAPGITLNVCSGTPRTGHEVLDAIVGALGLGGLEIEVDPSRIRPTDPPLITGNAAKVHAMSGWRPTRSFSQTVADVVADVR